ncbi:hypothetical protein ACFWZ2_38835 [Streptomyces sp. NPDC059002]|uniref:hypothetical protein n=1 Tax=Streptomyces sp. NPDC059002 TaxID=3346690 RepID=UPI0036BE7393
MSQPDYSYELQYRYRAEGLHAEAEQYRIARGAMASLLAGRLPRRGPAADGQARGTGTERAAPARRRHRVSRRHHPA